ncbi:MAG TPA: carbohydrate ABC transporter permease [Polyangiaceae bacterium]|nr:carbohydrate ABC transporter permease [Polyangiaceae bacterium]
MTRARFARLAEAALVHTVVLTAVLAALYPVLWVVSTALSPRELTMKPRALPWPSAASLDNFRTVVGAADASRARLFLSQVGNSLVVSLATAVIAVAIATPAAYALARFDFVGQKASLRTLLATQLFPTVASAVPLYLLLDALKLLDSRSGLVLVYAASAIPFALFQLRASFQAVPPELEEAAMVDGATRFGAFRLVAVPAIRPALAVTALFAVMSSWNEFVLAATLLSRESSFTLPVVLQRYVGEYDAAWGPFAAGSILVSLPVMGIFYLLQRHLVAGLTSGAVKG